MGANSRLGAYLNKYGIHCSCSDHGDFVNSEEHDGMHNGDIMVLMTSVITMMIIDDDDYDDDNNKATDDDDDDDDDDSGDNNNTLILLSFADLK